MTILQSYRRPTAACQTVGTGLAQCTGTGCGVLIEYGLYDLIDTVSMPSDTGLYGGCTSGSGTDDDYSLLTAPDGGIPAITMDGVRNVTLQGLQVQAGTASGTAGDPSIGVLVTGGSETIVFDLFGIVGGTGAPGASGADATAGAAGGGASGRTRSEEHTSELQSLMRISYAVFCLKKTKKQSQEI